MRNIFFVFLILFAAPVTALPFDPCTTGMLTPIEMITNLSKMALKENFVSPEQLLSSLVTDTPQNPLGNRSSSYRYISLRDGFRLALARLPKSEILSLHLAVEKVVSGARFEREEVQGAKASIRRVVSPHLIPAILPEDDDSAFAYKHHFFWHNVEGGGLRMISFNKKLGIVKEFQPSTGAMIGETIKMYPHDLVLHEDIQPVGLSTASGDFLLAAALPRTKFESPKIKVLNVTGRKAADVTLKYPSLSVSISQSFDGKIWLVSLSSEAIEVFELGKKVIPVRTIPGSFSRNSKFFTGPGGDVFLFGLIADQLKVYRPTQQSEPVEEWKTANANFLATMPLQQELLFPFVSSTGKVMAALKANDNSTALQIYSRETGMRLHAVSAIFERNFLWHEAADGRISAVFLAGNFGESGSLRMLRPLENLGAPLLADFNQPVEGDSVDSGMIRLANYEGVDYIVRTNRKPGSDKLHIYRMDNFLFSEIPLADNTREIFTFEENGLWTMTASKEGLQLVDLLSKATPFFRIINWQNLILPARRDKDGHLYTAVTSLSNPPEMRNLGFIRLTGEVSDASHP